MARLTYREAVIDIESGEDVLSALLRAGIDARHSCRVGVCQSCLHRVVDGKPPPAAQEGLSDAQKALGYFLACLCRPETSLTIVPAQEAGDRFEVSVQAIDRLGGGVVRLRLEHGPDFTYRPGQFVELIAEDGLGRRYSLASHPEEDRFIELHVRLYPDGKMSRLIAERLAPGHRMHVAGPLGTCVYEGIDPDQPICLAGSGTGLAPLVGILRDAWRRGHRGPIRLYHGVRQHDDLYLHDQLEALARERENFAYVPRVLSVPSPEGGDVAAAVLERETAPADTVFFLCGGERLVSRLKRELYLKGAPLKQLRADAFVPAS